MNDATCRGCGKPIEWWTRITDLHFVVLGEPIPQGSLKAFTPKGWNRPILTSDNKRTKPWKQEVKQMAMEAMAHLVPPVIRFEKPQAIGIECRFYFQRPKSTKKAVVDKTTKPDVDKLARAILDSLTGIVFEDDSQVTTLVAWKGFGDSRVEIWVSSL
jgi:Holliday junction resolvase RusA-like endonuclease